MVKLIEDKRVHKENNMLRVKTSWKARREKKIPLLWLNFIEKTILFLFTFRNYIQWFARNKFQSDIFKLRRIIFDSFPLIKVMKLFLFIELIIASQLLKNIKHHFFHEKGRFLILIFKRKIIFKPWKMRKILFNLFNSCLVRKFANDVNVQNIQNSSPRFRIQHFILILINFLNAFSLLTRRYALRKHDFPTKKIPNRNWGRKTSLFLVDMAWKFDHYSQNFFVVSFFSFPSRQCNHNILTSHNEKAAIFLTDFKSHYILEWLLF